MFTDGSLENRKGSAWGGGGAGRGEEGGTPPLCAAIASLGSHQPFMQGHGSGKALRTPPLPPPICTTDTPTLSRYPDMASSTPPQSPAKALASAVKRIWDTQMACPALAPQPYTPALCPVLSNSTSRLKQLQYSDALTPCLGALTPTALNLTISPPLQLIDAFTPTAIH
jgi:hypothetical protein